MDRIALETLMLSTVELNLKQIAGCHMTYLLQCSGEPMRKTERVIEITIDKYRNASIKVIDISKLSEDLIDEEDEVERYKAEASRGKGVLVQGIFPHSWEKNIAVLRLLPTSIGGMDIFGRA